MLASCFAIGAGTSANLMHSPSRPANQASTAKRTAMGDKTALIVVDVQADFVSGSLAVPRGAEVVPVIKRLLEHDWDVVVASQVGPSSLPLAPSQSLPLSSSLEVRSAKAFRRWH